MGVYVALMLLFKVGGQWQLYETRQNQSRSEVACVDWKAGKGACVSQRIFISQYSQLLLAISNPSTNTTLTKKEQVTGLAEGRTEDY